jgi:hypothetical protein
VGEEEEVYGCLSIQVYESRLLIFGSLLNDNLCFPKEVPLLSNPLVIHVLSVTEETSQRERERERERVLFVSLSRDEFSSDGRGSTVSSKTREFTVETMLKDL